MGFLDKMLGKQAKPTASAQQARPAAPAPTPASPPAPEPREMSGGEVREFVSANNAQVIDVRETDELLKSGWIPGAKHMPMSTFEGREREIDSERPVVVYCAGGVRSYNIGCHLMDKGFKEVINLTGGFHSWDGEKAAGTPPS